MWQTKYTCAKYFMQNKIHFSSKVLKLKKNPHSHKNKQLVWNQLSTKPMSKYMSKNSKLGRKTTNYLLISNYSYFNKMIQAYTWTIPFLGGSIDIAPYTHSCIIYRGSPYSLKNKWKLLWLSRGFFSLFLFPNFWCRWGGKHP